MPIKGISSIPFLNRIGCEHKYRAIGEFLQLNKDGSRTKKYIWKCRKCGKTKRG